MKKKKKTVSRSSLAAYRGVGVAVAVAAVVALAARGFYRSRVGVESRVGESLRRKIEMAASLPIRKNWLWLGKRYRQEYGVTVWRPLV